ncbi:hypothetical protein FB451DRAFT_1387510 [Mycena latifolia]|nr:hypothetical protein FB451DRAFT_1387510 [Mycena latifolia]
MPPELIDHIIDYLSDSVPELRVCTLVCKGWLSSSRHHLFRLIIVRDERLSEHLQIPSNVFAVYTRSLDLSLLGHQQTETTMPRIVPHLSSFLHLTSLIIGAVPPSPCYLPRLPRITKLGLQHTRFSSCCDFTGVLFSFSALRELELAWITWEDAGPGVFPRFKLDLESLLLQGFQDRSDILPWLLSDDHAPNTRGLALHIPNNASPTTLDAIATYLCRLDGHLHSLTLDVYPSPYLQRNVGLLALGRLTSLRSLRIGHGIYFYTGAQNACRIFPCVVEIISHFYPANCLDVLTFDVDIMPTESQLTGSLTALKNVLESPTVAQIREVRFNTASQNDSSVDYWKAFQILVSEQVPCRAFKYVQDS